MKLEVIWTWAAEADMQRLYASAEDNSEGSGNQLLSEVEKATALLLCFPQMAVQWRSPVRRLILRRRHLALFYVPEPRGIVVIGVADLRGDPDSWWSELQGRLP
ncbi:MAG: type II toxin-antitoxin system RelE/ParE family toxin [Prosthecobacter sp.]|uniref:type II toxin-antitoxin system RelE/ParE family toxin n=1 Tax=Prosthecobacter sp. TaxID=1965333 RepID=UPI0025E7F90E|nr:type II toxin-antitoxin system RelE/ParE family toxin [Prosthecobacter sp.]MCF7786642.1 type II toxin-antitoxin system RelE/ParE family toxin [Prosthecobacter sp.]